MAVDLPPRANGQDCRVRLTAPQALDLPFSILDARPACRLPYLSEYQGIAMKRSRLGEMLRTEGLRWRKAETRFGERVDPEFAAKSGR